MLTAVLFGMLDVVLAVGGGAANPHDPDEVAVEVRVRPPDLPERSWPAFWDGEAWRWRYRPLESGVQAGEVIVNGEVVDTLSFSVEAGDLAGPIRPDGHGFRYADGSAFVPLGLNLGWSAGEGAADYDRWFSRLAGAGGSFARVWLTHISDQDPEWAKAGRMEPGAAARVDALLDRALDHGILVMPVLWQHSELESAHWSSWDDSSYNAANGGPCGDSRCFFTDPAAQRLQDRLLRYAVARWGAHPALAAWEVMNEVDAIRGVEPATAAAWAARQADTLRALEGGLHPVSWSYAVSAQIAYEQPWAGADFAQLHCYLASDVVAVAGGVAATLEATTPPVLVGEWGLDWLGNLDREDTTGLAWHNANWAALASGAAGNALTWWWDNHVEPDDLWWRLEGPAALVGDLDLPSLAPVPVVVEGTNVEALARASGSAALVWLHDPRCTVPEPVCPEREGLAFRLPALPDSRARFHDSSTGDLVGEAEQCGGAPVAVPPFSGDVVALLEVAACGGEPEPEPDPEPGPEGGCSCAVTGPGPGPVSWLVLLSLLFGPCSRAARLRG